MFRPRIIPVLLLKNKALVKSVHFAAYTYIGDPINAVKIFNDFKADELVLLDIDAGKEKRAVSAELVRNIGHAANMPLAVGGGITSLEHIRSIIGAGAEKVVINSFAAQNPDFIKEAADTFGSSAIVVCMDVMKNRDGKLQTWTGNGTKSTGMHPVEFAKMMEQQGAGELIVQSIDRDGEMKGYDISLIKSVTGAVNIPVVALGGAGNLADMKQAFTEGGANGLAAGSMFVFKGGYKGVLINYPEKEELSFHSINLFVKAATGLT